MMMMMMILMMMMMMIATFYMVILLMFILNQLSFIGGLASKCFILYFYMFLTSLFTMLQGRWGRSPLYIRVVGTNFKQRPVKCSCPLTNVASCLLIAVYVTIRPVSQGASVWANDALLCDKQPNPIS